MFLGFDFDLIDIDEVTGPRPDGVFDGLAANLAYGTCTVGQTPVGIYVAVTTV